MPTKKRQPTAKKKQPTGRKKQSAAKKEQPTAKREQLTAKKEQPTAPEKQVTKKKQMSQKLAITQVRSRISRPPQQRRILDALGLRRHQQTVIHVDSAAVRGMVAKITHLVVMRAITEE